MNKAAGAGKEKNFYGVVGMDNINTETILKILSCVFLGIACIASLITTHNVNKRMKNNEKYKRWWE